MYAIYKAEEVLVARDKYKIPLVGHIFGKWKVLKYSHYLNEHYWLVLCMSCNRTFSRRAGQLVNGRTKSCQSCNAYEREKYSFWEGIDGVSKQYLTKLTYRQKEVTVSLQDLVDKWKQQQGRCVYSNLKLTLVGKDSEWKVSTASLDRIDSSKGYVPGNIQWVHKRINTMKNDMPEDEFILWCAAVVNHYNNGGSCGV